jgi:O-antigen ligase
MQKVVAIAALAVLGVGLVAVLPSETRARLATTFSDSAATDSIRESALGSKEARTYLLKKSVEAAVTHPIVGVGLEQFQNYEGVTARAAGQRGNWHETHNTYTQIASEAGIPGLIFLLGGIISTVRLLHRTYRKARQMASTPVNQKIRRTCFAVMLSLLSFSVAAFFLSMAYRCYLPAMTGIVIAVARAAEREWQLSPQAAANPV